MSDCGHVGSVGNRCEQCDLSDLRRRVEALEAGDSDDMRLRLQRAVDGAKKWKERAERAERERDEWRGKALAYKAERDERFSLLETWKDNAVEIERELGFERTDGITLADASKLRAVVEAARAYFVNAKCRRANKRRIAEALRALDAAEKESGR